MDSSATVPTVGELFSQITHIAIVQEYPLQKTVVCNYIAMFLISNFCISQVLQLTLNPELKFIFIKKCAPVLEKHQLFWM